MIYYGCKCNECLALPLGLGHTSDCAVHNEPAEPKGECDCGALEILDIKENWGKNWTYHAPVYIEKLLSWIFVGELTFDEKQFIRNKCENGTKIPDGGCFGCEEGDLCA